MIRFKNVSYTYPFHTEKALDSVSFELDKEEHRIKRTRKIDPGAYYKRACASLITVEKSRERFWSTRKTMPDGRSMRLPVILEPCFRTIVLEMIERFSLKKVMHLNIFDLSEGEKQKVTVHRTLKLEKRTSFKPDLRFVDVDFRLIPILQRRNPYGMHSQAGAWERETFKL